MARDPIHVEIFGIVSFRISRDCVVPHLELEHSVGWVSPNISSAGKEIGVSRHAAILAAPEPMKMGLVVTIFSEQIILKAIKKISDTSFPP